MPPEETSEAVAQKTEKVGETETRPKNQKILILLPEELQKKMKGPLRNRFNALEVIVPVETFEMKEEEQNKFQWILKFPWDVPQTPDHKPADPRLVFRVQGMAKINYKKLEQTHNKNFDTLKTRCFELIESLHSRQRSSAFLKLAQRDAMLRQKIIHEIKLKKKIEHLNRSMIQVEKPYHQAINYIFATAIEQLTGVAVLDGLMKGLVKIMIVDDLGTRTLDGMVALNYSRKYLSFMSSSELEAKFKAFKQQHLEDQEKETNISEFIFKSPDFESIDIVFFNRWNFSDDEFLVPVLLRKKTILSKQEQRKSNQNPEYIEKQIESETNSIKQAEKNLKEVLKEINKMEKGRYQEEDEYQALRSSQKRIQKDIDRRKNRLKSLEKPVKQSDQAVVIKFDLYETFKEKQSFMDRLGDKVADWGLDSLWEKHMNPDDRFSFNKLHQMSGVAKEWIKRNNEYNRSKLFTERLKDQLNDFAGKYGMLVKESRSRAAGPGSYQPMLDDHILDSLELAVINCEILNRIEQSRENAKDQL
ncbi:MAG: hypothetical protein ACPGD7_13280 [bacterium]